jgi:hypothetical protein
VLQVYFVHSYRASASTTPAEWVGSTTDYGGCATGDCQRQRETQRDTPVPTADSGCACACSCSCGGCAFVSSVARGPVFATQFHPEKSGSIGLGIFKHFFEAFLSNSQTVQLQHQLPLEPTTTALRYPAEHTKLARRIVAYVEFNWLLGDLQTDCKAILTMLCFVVNCCV